MIYPRNPKSPGSAGYEPASREVSTSDAAEKYKDYSAVVIDTGTGYTKSGLAGDEKPRSVVPSRVGVPKVRTNDSPLYYIGKSIPSNSSEVIANTVMTHGVVTDWDALEMLWHHIFYTELSVCPEELAVLVTDAPLSPTTNREKMAELLFENFEVPAMFVAHQSLLSVYSYGRTKGLVIGSGYGTSYTAPVHDGYVLPHATYRLDVAGCALTDYLAKLMGECGNPFREDELELVSNIKEKCCYIPEDFHEELNGDEKKYLMDFILPDQQVISIGSERFRGPEALFNPAVLGFPEAGIHIHAMNSIRKCKPKHRAELLANVVLAGGTTMIRGFSERIKKELLKMEMTGKEQVAILASPHRSFAAWLGGSIVASLNSFQNVWISQKDYSDKGPFVVHRHSF
ncbi:actin-like [Alligator sinensis]|uniref:Actin-like n=1 Tax=Alligator sinensis TaxID=38654 RepID=A0A1U7RKI8_ALLSI|nr:actin-like [Alligator sinensis]XP_006025070.3 actin-like [Alligator sinensis]